MTPDRLYFGLYKSTLALESTVNILPFPKNIQAHSQPKPIQTSVWTFDVAGRVFSVQVDYWKEQNAPSNDYPLRFVPEVLATARIIDWHSGATYGPRALSPAPQEEQEAISLDYEHRLPEGPVA